jgi:hypothetical protein
MGDLLHVFLRQKTMWLLQNLWANALLTTRKQGVKGLGRNVGGQRGHTGKLATQEGRSCKGEHMVMVCGEGLQCVGQRNDESDGDLDRITTHMYVATKKKTVGSFCVCVCSSIRKETSSVDRPIKIQPSYLVIFLQSRAIYSLVDESLRANRRG